MRRAWSFALRLLLILGLVLLLPFIYVWTGTIRLDWMIEISSEWALEWIEGIIGQIPV